MKREEILGIFQGVLLCGLLKAYDFSEFSDIDAYSSSIFVLFASGISLACYTVILVFFFDKMSQRALKVVRVISVLLMVYFIGIPDYLWFNGYRRFFTGFSMLHGFSLIGVFMFIDRRLHQLKTTQK